MKRRPGSPERRILVTGATGKVGRTFLERLESEPKLERFQVRALCHRRSLRKQARVECLRGDLADRATARKAMQGVSHVLHLATCKETPERIMDVAVKGLFWLLEECRESPTFRQFLLVGGDASIGHFYYPHALPVTEIQAHSAYPGCYALSKVLEETMLEQYFIQHDLNGCCLRAPWIMEKDDFKWSLSFGEDVFGGPRWCDLVGKTRAKQYLKSGTIPVLCDADGDPVLRNFVHVNDLVDALVAAIDAPAAHQETFNVCMDEPVNYRQVARFLADRIGLASVDVRTPYHSTWLDNSKAKFLLDWRPRFDWRRLVEDSFAYQRAPNDVRKVWYPG